MLHRPFSVTHGPCAGESGVYASILNSSMLLASIGVELDVCSSTILKVWEHRILDFAGTVVWRCDVFKEIPQDIELVPAYRDRKLCWNPPSFVASSSPSARPAEEGGGYLDTGERPSLQPLW